MTDKFMRLPAVIEHTGLSRRTIYRKMEAGEFPQSVRLGPQAVAWRESEVARWMEAPTEWKDAA